jgi:hypothetical protein
LALVSKASSKEHLTIPNPTGWLWPYPQKLDIHFSFFSPLKMTKN